MEERGELNIFIETKLPFPHLLPATSVSLSIIVMKHNSKSSFKTLVTLVEQKQ